VIFNNPRSGLFKQPRERRNMHYHPCECCIYPTIYFDCPSIMIPDNVKAKLEVKYKDLLNSNNKNKLIL